MAHVALHAASPALPPPAASPALPPPPPPPPKASLLPPGWSDQVDVASGRTYFYNEYTGESRWDRPTLPSAC
eukprot:2098616-Prymnesium_polylepis.1